MKQSTTNKAKNKKSAPAARTEHKTGGRQSSSSARAESRGNNNNPARSSASSTREESSSMRGNANTPSRNAEGKKSGAKYGANHQQSFKGESHLEKFFLDLLQDIYYAEKKIVQSLPKMQEAATTDELKEAFEDHLHQTQRHVRRLEKVFETLNQKAEGKKCEAIEGIAREVDNIIEETEEGTMTRDAALIIAAQKVEHYEIATYGGLLQLAITMQLHDAADLLDKTLIEEEDTDARLTEIAESEINLQAEHEGGGYGSEQNESGEEEESEENEGDEDVDEESPNL